ncbi:hypothetical protein QU668_06645 [Schaalia sp. HMT-877]|nr:hypothetical protein QU668_06645 [Schaalia sp. HMT-877]
MLKPMNLRHYVPAALAFACASALANASLACPDMGAATAAPPARTIPAAPGTPGAPTSDSAQSTPPGRSPMTMVCTSEREGIPGSAARPGDPSVASAHCQYVPAPTLTNGPTASTPPGRSPMTMVCTSEREGIPGSAARPGDPSVASAHCQYVPAPTPTGGSAGQ